MKMRYENKIGKHQQHEGKQLVFYQKVRYIKTHRLGKEECFCNLCIAINSNLLDKNQIPHST